MFAFAVIAAVVGDSRARYPTVPVFVLAELPATNALLDAALSYATSGYYVFPTHDLSAGACSCGGQCASPGKHPRTPHGFQDATLDAVTIAAWWKRWPNANVAIDCGRSGLVVVDVDIKNGAQGEATMRWFLEREDLPFRQTFLVGTPSGGYHFYFSGHVPKFKAAQFPGIDFQGSGAYVLAPPSIGANAHAYHVLQNLSIVPFPAALVPLGAADEQTIAFGQTRAWEGPERPAIPYGEHRQALLWYGWHLRSVLGLSLEAALPLMQAFLPTLEGYDSSRPFTARELGKMLANVKPNVASSPPPGPGPALDPIMEAAEVMAIAPPPRQIVIPGLMIRGELHVYYGPDGVGKGHPISTRVLTPTGWRAVGDLHVGDSIIGSDGRGTKVTEIYERGELPVYRVTMTDKSSVLVDGDHLWAVRAKKQKTPAQRSRSRKPGELYRTVETRALKANRTEIIPQVSPVQYPHADLPLSPYALGLLLANGHFGENTPTLALNKLDTDVAARFLRETQGTQYPTTTAARFGLPGGRAILRGLALDRLRSAEKFIPRSYLHASYEQRLALLQGILDGDGSVRYDTTHSQALFHTTARGLVLGVRELVESLGGIVSLYFKARQGTKAYTEYKLGITLPKQIKPFYGKRKGERYKPRRTPLRKIASVMPEGSAIVRCIKVAAADQLYVTERHIVTHNTSLVAYLIALVTLQGRDVLVFINEDAPRDFLIKCAYAGADMTRLYVYNAGRSVREFLLPKCKVDLEAMLQQRNWGCVYFDSINDLKSTDFRLNAADEARQLFGPLSAFAQQYDTAILCTAHTNARDVLEGARQIRAKARVVARVERPNFSPESHDDGTISFGLLQYDPLWTAVAVTEKFSRGKPGAAYAFMFEERTSRNPFTGEYDFEIQPDGVHTVKMQYVCHKHELLPDRAHDVLPKPRKDGDLEARIYDVVRNCPGFTPNDIVKQIGGDRTRVLSIIRKAKEELGIK